MIRAAKARLGYANVTSTIAVFIALGGTGYAATQLPRNSVSSPQIRAKAVGSSELRSRAVTSSKIRPGSVTASKLSRSALAKVRGVSGPPGPQGPAGPAATTLRASITSGGTAVGGNSRGATHNSGSGPINEYRVLFDRSVAACTPTATLARLQNGATVEDPPAGRITVATEENRVLVRTFGADGSPAELPFNLVVAC